MDFTRIKQFFASLTLEKLLPVIVILVVGIILVKLLLKLFDRVLERSKLDRTMFSFLKAVMRVLLYSILALVAAGSLGVDVSSLVAILSVISLAVSLAVQNALSNVVGSMTLLATHPLPGGRFRGDQRRQRHGGGDQHVLHLDRHCGREANLYSKQRCGLRPNL